MNYEQLKTIDGSVPLHTITLDIDQINQIIGFCELHQRGAITLPGGSKAHNDAVTNSILNKLEKVFSLDDDVI